MAAEEPGKLKGILFWFMVFSSIYAISTVVVAISAYIELSNSVDEVTGILRNWSLLPVTDVKLVAGTAQCGADWEHSTASWEVLKEDISVHLINGKGYKPYNGISFGCECWNAWPVTVTTTRTREGADGKKKTVTETEQRTYSWHYVMNKGQCTGEQSSHGCNERYPPVGYSDLHIWKGTKLCLKRSGTTPMQKSDEESLDNGCPGGLVDCSMGEGRPHCAETEAACPIYGLHVIPQIVAVPSGWTADPAFLTGNKKLIWTKSKSAAQTYRETLPYAGLRSWNKPTPVVELALEPCYYNPHLLGPEKDWCSNMDVRQIEFDTEDARALLLENMGPTKYSGFKEKSILHNTGLQACNQNGGNGECVYFEPATSAKWRTTQIPEVFWSRQCAKEGARKSALKDHRNPMEDIVLYQMFVLIFCIFNTIANLVLAGLFAANYLCNKDLPCFPGAGHEEYQHMEKFRKYLGLVCKILVVPFCFIAYWISSDITGFFDDIKAKNCSDPSTNATVIKLTDGIGSVADKNLSALIMTLFVCLLEICMWLRARRTEQKKKESDNEVKKIEDAENKEEETNKVDIENPKNQQSPVDIPLEDPKQAEQPNAAQGEDNPVQTNPYTQNPYQQPVEQPTEPVNPYTANPYDQPGMQPSPYQTGIAPMEAIDQSEIPTKAEQH